MRKARFTEHQIIAVIKSVEAGRSLSGGQCTGQPINSNWLLTEQDSPFTFDLCEPGIMSDAFRGERNEKREAFQRMKKIRKAIANSVRPLKLITGNELFRLHVFCIIGLQPFRTAARPARHPYSEARNRFCPSRQAAAWPATGAAAA